jgi:competence protein ComEA
MPRRRPEKRKRNTRDRVGRDLHAGPWVLRRADQAAAGALLAVALLAIAGYWVVRGGASGRMIEIDRSSPRNVEFQVDVNTAPWPELTAIPDIGETLARRIVESRQTDGPFIDHNDLLRVRGIGPRTLETMKPYLLPLPDARNVADGGADGNVRHTP